jgi:ribonucleoside-triphosphate reductase (formate)
MAKSQTTPHPEKRMTQSVRAQVVERRTYLRPIDTNGTIFETSEQSWRRVIEHQRWLWERAQRAPLSASQEAELEELFQLFMERKVTVSGRTRWLGGTEVAKHREICNFNCAFLNIQTVRDVQDAMWLLLNGVGVGFRPVPGSLNGFAASIGELEVIRSTKILPRDEFGNGISSEVLKGAPNNVNTFDRATGHWYIRVGDSAEAWAELLGIILSDKHVAKKLTIDFSEIRPEGYRLARYGWLSSGDTVISKFVADLFGVLNASAGKLLDEMAILDVLNMMGTILSSRRSAEIALLEYTNPVWREFASAKKDYWTTGKPWRAQSNNSLVFMEQPTREQLVEIFDIMMDAGGSEPGFINGASAKTRAPYWAGLNPCSEILLPASGGTCNLVETMVSRFNGNTPGLLRAHYLIARANYRQACVDFRDGVLQEKWHQNNEFLRLTGVGVTGIVGWVEHTKPEAWRALRKAAHDGANSMADELGLARSKNVTTVKPAGTQSKAGGLIGDELTEGMTKPLGRYIFNTISFSREDPLVRALTAANYRTMPHPFDQSSILVTLPVEYSNVPFDKVVMEVNGEMVECEVNLDSAVSQLGRYKLIQDNYTDHNTSNTISYSPEEVPEIIDWLLENWDSYVGVSFLYRTDPTKTAEDLGFSYLPQQVVDPATYHAYVGTLGEVNFSGTDIGQMLDDLNTCGAGGACPIR